jgi:drug/metabolite transporter (DMT)-like permease
MKWTKQDSTLVAVVWLGVAAVIVGVCLALPAPPPPGDPQFVPVLLDFFFGAILVSVVAGAAAVFCAFRFVQRLGREVDELRARRPERPDGRDARQPPRPPLSS